MRFVMLVLAFLGFAAGRASAQQSDPYSAAALVSACRSYIENSVLPEPEAAFKEGVCCSPVRSFNSLLRSQKRDQPAGHASCRSRSRKSAGPVA